MVRGVADAVRAGQARFDLVLGPRGAGKSHLLGLIEGRLRKELEGVAIVAGPPEELHPSSLLHLLAEILRSLPADPEFGPVERQISILAASPQDARDRAVGMIRARLRELPLVIVIENLDVIFSAIGRDGQHQLRSILQTERRWSILATSRSRAPAFSKESEPFFGTFIFRTLEPLSSNGCRDLLVRLARTSGREELARELDTPKGLARVQTLRHVLGGYPRAMAFIFPHLHHDSPDAVEQALGDLADELTPYFQEQMSRLPPGQRPIAELLAEHWTPLSVTEIVRATFTPQPMVSTYLRRLAEDAIVRSTKLGRVHFYEISDPLFRIARAMKRNDLRAKTFLRVLQGWYELRGLDVWRLPAINREEILAAADDGMEGDHDDALFEQLWLELERCRYDELIEIVRASESPHPLRSAFLVVALSLLGKQEDAFATLVSVGSSQLQTLILETAFIEEEQSRRGARRARPTPAPVSLVGRFCGAAISIDEILAAGDEHTSSEAFAAIEQPLHSESRVIREAATKVILELMLIADLAEAGAHEPCRRLVGLLEPIGSEALSFNLAWTMRYAWAKDRFSEVFGRSPEKLSVLSKGLGPLAKVGINFMAYDTQVPPSIQLETEEAFTEALASGSLQMNRYSPADWMWVEVFVIVMVRNASVERWSRLEDWLRDSETRTWLSNALHAGILLWIASGRDLSPIRLALAVERQLAASSGPRATIVEHTDPNARYVQLAAPERAMVRDLAKSLGLEERHSELCRLASEDA